MRDGFSALPEAAKTNYQRIFGKEKIIDYGPGSVLPQVTQIRKIDTLSSNRS